MQNLFGREDFLSLCGIQNLKSHIEQSGNSTNAVVSTHLNSGALRILSLQMRAQDSGYSIAVQHFFSDGHGNSEVTDILNLKCQNAGNSEITITEALLDGKPLDPDNGSTVFALTNVLKSFSDAITRRNEWVNPVQVIEDGGLPLAAIGRRAWPGLYANGDQRNFDLSEPNVMNEQVYPALFLPAILGVGPESYSGEKEKSRVLTIYSSGDEAKGCVLKYHFRHGKGDYDINVEGKIAVHDREGTKKETLYKIKARTVPGQKAGKITSLHFMGQRINIQDARAVAATLKVIRNINRVIRAGDQALIDDLKKAPHERRFALPSELMLYTNLHEHLNDPETVPERGIMTFAAVGGNNVEAYLSSSDQHIGANQYVLTYTKKGHDALPETEAVMIDAGVLFHNVFNVAFYNPSRYLQHKFDKSHHPKHPLKAILFTHRHADHIGQLAYLVKCGYELPPLIMNEISMLQLKSDMSELGIERAIREEIFAKCYPVNLLKDINPQNPAAKKTTVIGDTTIEQWTEVLPGKELGRSEYYPVIQIGSFTCRVGPMPHSDPGFMYDIITPAGSHRHTGDYKLDDTILMGLPKLDIWLKGHEPDSLSADSTGALREGSTPKEADIRRSIGQVLSENKDKRFIFPVLGSNLARLTSLVAALDEADRRILIADGMAVERLIRFADKAYEFKQWAKDVHNVEVLFRTQKKAKKLVSGKEGRTYALIVSGTQDEFLSSINRAARDWLPPDRYSLDENDIIIPLQGPIPVDNNIQKRRGLAYEVEMFHGATVLLPEKIKEESDLLLAGSGHPSREDKKAMIEMSGCPVVIPVHGGPDQLKAHADLASDVGAHALILPAAVNIKISKGKKVTPYHVLPTQFVGVSLHTPSREKFYLKSRFSTSVMPVLPPANSNVASLVYAMEDAVRARSGINSGYQMAKVLPVSLARTFNATSANGFLEYDMPFGIQKLRGSVFEQKNIFVVACLDTETTGLNARHHRIREFAITYEDLERNHLGDYQVFQRVPEYIIPSPKALLVTGVAPKSLKIGLPAHLFVSSMNMAIEEAKAASFEEATTRKPEAGFKKANIKTLAIGHNIRFDSNFIEKEEGRNLDTNVRPHQTRGMIAVDTRNISRAIAAYFPNEYFVDTNPETGLPNHKLDSLCKANGLAYDETSSHGALYDTKPCLDLFWHQHGLAPEIVEQMIINSDSSKSQLLNDMMGMDTGFGGPHPVFSYVSPYAKRPLPQMGCFLGTLDTERYAVIFNLKYDPHDYLNLPTQKVLELLKDKDCDIFEVFDMRQQPIIVPASYGFRVKANGRTPKETMDTRAGIVRRHLNYVDPESEWMTIAQKISAAWDSDRASIFASRIAEQYPDLDRKLGNLEKKISTPEDGIVKLLQIRAKLGFNPVFQKIHALLRSYVGHLRNEDYDGASEVYAQLLEHRTHLGSDAMRTIDNVHYDISKKDLNEVARKSIEAMRHFMGFVSYQEAQADLASLENDPDEFTKFIGDDPQKLKLFGQIKKWMASQSHLAKLNDDARAFAHPWRTYTNNNYPEAGGPSVGVA